MKKLLRVLSDPRILAIRLLDIFSMFIPDAMFLRMKFFLKMGRRLDLSNPKTFNEKLQWLKLYNRQPVYTTMVDKIAAKEYVAGIIGNKYIIPTIGTYDSVDGINWEKLPNKFVIKCTHDSGGVVVCDDKSNLDIDKARRTLAAGLKTDYYNSFREWPYKNVPRRLICEEYMVDESGYELKDYKFFCFNGEPKAFKVDFGRSTEHHANYYDMSWNLLEFDEVTYPRVANAEIHRPENFDRMIEITRKLSHGIPFVRIDLYNISGEIYFGEMTFFPTSGLTAFEPEEWDENFGNWLSLPSQKTVG